MVMLSRVWLISWVMPHDFMGVCLRGNSLPRGRMPVGVWGIPPVAWFNSV